MHCYQHDKSTEMYLHKMRSSSKGSIGIGSSGNYSIVCLLVLLLVISSFQIYIHYVSPPWNKLGERVESRLTTTFALIAPEDVKAKAFDWEAYILVHHDLQQAGFRSKDVALNHFKQYGTDEGRIVPVTPMANPSFAAARKKLENMITMWEEWKVPHEYRYLLLYYAKSDKENDSLDVLRNNFHLFTSALSRGNYTYRHQVFYWFNIADHDKNPLSSIIQEDGVFSVKNVALVNWNYESNEMFNFIKTMQELPIAMKQKVGYFIFLTTDVRGPIRNRANLDWMMNMDYLVQLGKVALVGNDLACDQTSYLSYPLVTSSRYWQIFENSLLDQSLVDLLPKLNIAYLSQFFVSNGYLIASTTLLRKGWNPLLSDIGTNCTFKSTTIGTSNMVLMDTDSEFLRWAPSILYDSSYLLTSAEKDKMGDILSLLSRQDKLLSRKITIPEVLRSGMKVDFYRQYDRENLLPVQSIPPTEVNKPKVCFVVRTAALNDIAYKVNGTVRGSVQELIASLRRQQNPHWLAFFFVTDQDDYWQTLLALLQSYTDTRLVYHYLDEASIPKYDPVDAAYSITDKVLDRIIATRKECQWITATNGDNVYGSKVVKQILRASALGFSNEIVENYDMLLNPVDSRNFANADYRLRQMSTWDSSCVGLMAMQALNHFAFTTRGYPVVGGVDLSSVFFRRASLEKINLRFSNFTDLKKFPCMGCQDGYFVEHLVKSYRWKYYFIPIDGLSSIVFHGPSPALCLAAGNVWFDHPKLTEVDCLSQSEVLSRKDNDIGNLYDWQYFETSKQVCLRFNARGFTQAR